MLIFRPSDIKYNSSYFQNLVWLKQNKEAVVPSEDFLAVLRCTDSLDELVATQQIVRHEIAVQRSRDTGGEQDEQVKQQLKSLFYVDEIITSWYSLSLVYEKLYNLLKQ